MMPKKAKMRLEKNMYNRLLQSQFSPSFDAHECESYIERKALRSISYRTPLIDEEDPCSGDAVLSVDTNADGTEVATGHGGHHCVNIFRFLQNGIVKKTHMHSLHDRSVFALKYHPTLRHRLVTCCFAGTIKVHDTKTETTLAIFNNGPANTITGLSFFHDEIIACAVDRSVLFWMYRKDMSERKLQTHMDKWKYFHQLFPLDDKNNEKCNGHDMFDHLDPFVVIPVPKELHQGKVAYVQLSGYFLLVGNADGELIVYSTRNARCNKKVENWSGCFDALRMFPGVYTRIPTMIATAPQCVAYVTTFVDDVRLLVVRSLDELTEFAIITEIQLPSTVNPSVLHFSALGEHVLVGNRQQNLNGPFRRLFGDDSTSLTQLYIYQVRSGKLVFTATKRDGELHGTVLRPDGSVVLALAGGIVQLLSAAPVNSSSTHSNVLIFTDSTNLV